MEKITFDKSANEFILEAFGKTLDEGGFIVEKLDKNQKVLTRDAQEIHIDQFAGVRKGSEIFIKSDLPSIIELSDDLTSDKT